MVEQTRKLVVKSALRVVHLSKLRVDPSYQRGVKGKHKKIVAEFNKDALGIPLVGEREDGGLWIVDGLQRVTALQKLGHTVVRAEVFNSSGPEYEAEVFKLVNMNRVRLTPGEQFQARLTSGDKEAWRIKEAVEACGFRMSLAANGSRNTKRPDGAKTVACVNALVEIVSRQGTEPLTFTLKLVPEAWPDDPLAVHFDMVKGLCTFWSQMKGVIDMDRLLPRLRKTTPHKILYAASQATIVGEKRYAVAAVVEKVYRGRLKNA